jgi:hypothetical protein
MTITNLNRQRLLRQIQSTTKQVAGDLNNRQEQQEQPGRRLTRTYTPSQNQTTVPAKEYYNVKVQRSTTHQGGKASTRPTNHNGKASAQTTSNQDDGGGKVSARAERRRSIHQ